MGPPVSKSREINVFFNYEEIRRLSKILAHLLLAQLVDDSHVQKSARWRFGFGLVLPLCLKQLSSLTVRCGL